MLHSSLSSIRFGTTSSLLMMAILLSGCQTEGFLDVKQGASSGFKSFSEGGQALAKTVNPYIPKIPYSDYIIEYQCRGTTTAKAYYHNDRQYGISGEQVGSLELEYLGKTYRFDRVINKPLWQAYVATLNTTPSSRLQWFVRGQSVGLRNLKDDPAEKIETKNLLNECTQVGIAKEISPVKKTLNAAQKEVVINRDFELALKADQELKGPDLPVIKLDPAAAIVTRTEVTAQPTLFGTLLKKTKTQSIMTTSNSNNEVTDVSQTTKSESLGTNFGKWFKKTTSTTTIVDQPANTESDQPVQISKKVLDREILINVP